VGIAVKSKISLLPRQTIKPLPRNWAVALDILSLDEANDIWVHKSVQEKGSNDMQ
jgi:hypothetical protein